MDFGQPNVEIGRKMANGQLLFLALHVCIFCQLSKTEISSHEITMVVTCDLHMTHTYIRYKNVSPITLCHISFNE